MKKTILILGTLDTKGRELDYLRQQVERLGKQAVMLDMGVVGSPTASADIGRDQVASAGGCPLSTLIESPSREQAAPVMIRGATNILRDRIARHQVHGAIGIGGTQGTSSICQVLQALPYGFPKVMVSTCAAGDTSAFVGVKDITMMFSVSDILGLNPFMRNVLTNAAGAVCGMADASERSEATPAHEGRRTIGITNLGVLTAGATLALEYLDERGYEAIVFHAVGAGGRAMEQMMRDGLIQGVFDYALGEIADDVFHALRAGGPERLTTAGKLGIPQVLCPGGAEHIGIFLDKPLTLPEAYADHLNVFHSPIIAAPRLKPEQLVDVAREIGRRLQHTTGRATFMLPLRGVSRYSIASGPLFDPVSDQVFFDALKQFLPPTIEVVEVDAAAEDAHFVRACCDRLIEWMRADR